MRSPSSTRTFKKYCMFYRDKGYKTKKCCMLKKEIKRLIDKGYFQKSLANLYRHYPKST